MQRTYKGYRYMVRQTVAGSFTWGVYRPSPQNETPIYNGEAVSEEYAVYKAEECIDKITA